jgi:preprotein translocase subunit YajC
MVNKEIIYIVVFLVVIIVLFYFFMIRPQRRRQKEHLDFLNQMRSGDRVVTSGGIYGIVESVDQNSVILKVESGATMRVAKSAIVGRVQ